MSEHDFPYGAKPTHPHVRRDLQQRAEAMNAAVRVYEEHLDDNKDRFYLDIEPQDLLDALHLTPVIAPTGKAKQRTFTGKQIAEDLEDEVLIDEIASRLEDPEFAHKMGEVIGKRAFGWVKQALGF